MKLYGVDIGGCSKISANPKARHIQNDVYLTERFAKCFVDVVVCLCCIVDIVLILGEVILFVGDVDLYQ